GRLAQMRDAGPRAGHQPSHRACDRLAERLRRPPREQLSKEARESRIRDEVELRSSLQFRVAQAAAARRTGAVDASPPLPPRIMFKSFGRAITRARDPPSEGVP